MRIKVLTNLGTNDFPESPFKDGEEHEVNDELGSKLIRLRLAVDITPPPAPKVVAVKAVEPPLPAPIPVVAPKQEPAVVTASATAPKFKTSKEK
jgi:hypothetical protein